MKILIAAFSFPPNKDGVAEAAEAGAEAFLKRGWEVDVATEPVRPSRASLIWRGARIHEFSITGSSYWRHPYRGQIREYQDFLRSGTWDVVIFHAYLWPLYLAVPILESIQSRKVLVSHGFGGLVWVPVARFPFGLMVLAHSFWLSLRMLSWIKKIDRWVFLSSRCDLRAFFDHWLARRIGHPGIRVIPNGVVLPDSRMPSGHFRKKHGIPKNSTFFLCVANYSLRKDQGFAVRAFRQAALPGSHLVFIGSEFNEASRKFQREDAQDDSLPQPGTVHWLESIPREETLAALAECDVFILSASHEGQPFVLLEAMAMKKPWVARRAGCISELPGGLPVSTPKKMAEAMKDLASHPEKGFSLAEQGHAAVQSRFSREEYGTNYCNLVEELTRGHT